MTNLEREMEIIRLFDRRNMLGMMNISHLKYEDQVKARAQYRLDINEIDKKLLELRSQQV